MQTKVIKSKHVNDGILELIEFIDDFGKIIKYEIALGRMQKDVVGDVAGELKKIAEFENESEALNFFDNQI